MLLCLNIGNTHIFGGLYEDKALQFSFRHASFPVLEAKKYEAFFQKILEDHGFNSQQIKEIRICSVVPVLDELIQAACLNYFKQTPVFLTAKNASPLKIAYKNPNEVGADRLSTALAAIHHYPNQPIIVIDLGTATTLDIITADKQFLGGIIMPGLYISMKALAENTAKLPLVEIIKPRSIIGQTTIENIQAGLYYGHLGSMREMVQQIKTHLIVDQEITILGTGGFAPLFANEPLFSAISPYLVLEGLLSLECST